MSFKKLFTRSLAADPSRLHFAAHSHHLWPDASYDGHVQAWIDAAQLADRKWGKILEEIWPAAQAEVASELGTHQSNAISFASNTHELLVRLITSVPRSPVRVLTSDGEFHSATRQLARWEEAGAVSLERVPVEPFDTFSARFLEAAQSGIHDVILVSHVMFGSGQIFDRHTELAALARPTGPWVIIDGYHAFMALPHPLASPQSTVSTPPKSRTVPPIAAAVPAASAFYLGGGYKYAMAGEGCAFLHAPDGYAARPTITGWFAEFEDLSLPRRQVGYAEDARRLLGATFDPSGLYRFLAVRKMLQSEGITTTLVARHVELLQRDMIARLAGTSLGRAELLNPLNAGPHARFLAFRSSRAKDWHEQLKEHNCITDVRGNVLRIGFGLYQDESDVERLAGLLRRLP